MSIEAVADVVVTDFDPASMLDDAESIAMFVQHAAEESGNDPKVITKALGIALRAHNRLEDIANEAAISRQGLHKVLNGKCTPSLTTFLNLTKAAGLTLRFEAAG